MPENVLSPGERLERRYAAAVERGKLRCQDGDSVEIRLRGRDVKEILPALDRGQRAETSLNLIAGLIQPCSVPYVMGAFVPCTHGTWPCAYTRAAWIARGVDGEAEVRRIVANLNQIAASDPAYRP